MVRQTQILEVCFPQISVLFDFVNLNFQNFRFRNSFRFCLFGENIPGNFSHIGSLLVKCVLEDSFEGRGKVEYRPRKILSEPTREHTANSTHVWRPRRDLNAGHIVEVRVLSLVRHPCSTPAPPPPHPLPLSSTLLNIQKGSTQA